MFSSRQESPPFLSSGFTIRIPEIPGRTGTDWSLQEQDGDGEKLLLFQALVRTTPYNVSIDVWASGVNFDNIKINHLEKIGQVAAEKLEPNLKFELQSIGFSDKWKDALLISMTNKVPVH